MICLSRNLKKGEQKPHQTLHGKLIFFIKIKLDCYTNYKSSASVFILISILYFFVDLKFGLAWLNGLNISGKHLFGG